MKSAKSTAAAAVCGIELLAGTARESKEETACRIKRPDSQLICYLSDDGNFSYSPSSSSQATAAATLLFYFGE
jgi:hypothetical protein